MEAVDLRSVVVETISMCTQRCFHCKYGVINVLPRVMPGDFVYKIVDDLAAVNYDKRLSFFCGNEPLLDPSLEDFFAYASRKLPRAVLDLTSNGDLATISVLEKLFNAGMQKILFSLHSKTLEGRFEKYQEAFGSAQISFVDHTEAAAMQRFNNRGGLVKSKSVSQKLHPNSNCALPFKQMVVWSDCTVGLCCVDMNETIKIQVEAKHKQSIYNLFYDSKMLNKFRTMLQEQRRDLAPCCDCSYSGWDGFE